MSTDSSIRSILALDIGATLTHAALLEPVEGAHRMVACVNTPTTLRPQTDLVASLHRSVERIQEIVGRRLFDEDGTPSKPRQGQKGIDALIVTLSAAAPLECALIGLTEDLSLKSARAACQSGHTIVRREIILAQERHARHRELAALRQDPSEVIIIAGGVDGGPVHQVIDAAELLATLFADLEPQLRPTVLFAGNQEARRPIAAALGPDFGFGVVDNVQPTPDLSSPQELQRELAHLYERRKFPELAGYDTLSEWTSIPLMASQTGLRAILQFLSRQGLYGSRVLGLDVGGRQTTAALANGRLVASQSIQVGMSQGLEDLLHAVDIEYIQRWLPTEDLTRRAAAQLGNQALRPQSLPTEPDDLVLIQAAMREAVRLTLTGLTLNLHEHPRETWAVDAIAARGGSLLHARPDAQATLALLDAVQPVGTTRLLLDWASVWPQLGALAQIEPLAALQVLDRDALLDLGTIVSLPGQGDTDQTAAHLSLLRNVGGVQVANIDWGHLLRLDLDHGETAILEINPVTGTWQGSKETRSVKVQGGRLGLILDARGRPLALPEDAEMRRGKMQTWTKELS